MACRAFRDGRFESWIDPVCGNAVMEVPGPVEPSSPNRDAIPLSYDDRIRRFAQFVCDSLKRKRHDTQFMGDTGDTVSGGKMG